MIARKFAEIYKNCRKIKILGMRLCLLLLGKTTDSFVKEGILSYQKRIEHYVPFEIKVLSDIKNTRNMPMAEQMKKEGELLLNSFKEDDEIILLDEKGKERNSIDFAKYLNEKMLYSNKRMVFVVGGPYGFSKEVYQKAHGKISLSAMTFSHQLVRVVFLEQLYRAMTIIKGEPYHHG